MKNLFRKVTTLLIVLSAAFAIGIISVSASEHILYGDIDMNNRITYRDALSVMLHVVKNTELTDEQLIRADVDDDGDVDAEDGKLIFYCAAGLESGFRIDEITANGTMWIAGDSIAEGGSYYVGWGQIIDDYLLDTAKVNNTAISGKTAKAFTESANYKRIMDEMMPGDVLMICFGHNEASGLEGTTIPEMGSDYEGSFKYYLKNYYIEPALRRGVQPILMSSVARAWGSFLSIEDQYHYRWTKAAKELAEEYKANGIDLPFIDLFTITTTEYLYMGKETALTTFHAELDPDEEGNRQFDTVHYNETGARFAAQIILCEMKELGFDYAKYINEETLTDPRQYDGLEPPVFEPQK